jgi:multidrug efflux pump subunit AcrA (membrane-fusion protein)
MSRSGNVEKVRGMNAALATSNGNALSERRPSPVHISRRQVAFALLLAVLGVIAAIYTVNAVTQSQQTFPAVVSASKVYDLNFANTGRVTAINVKVGQRVTAGQPLASQDTATLASQVAADETAVTADTAQVAEAQTPQLTGAQREQDALQLEQAQTALANAHSQLASADASGKASVANAQLTVTADQSLADQDKVQYQQGCPSGPVPPPANATPVQVSAFTHCQDLQLQLNKDLTTLALAQADVPVAQAGSQQSANAAQAAVNTAQAAVNLAENQQALQSAPSNSATLAQAQANLTQAQSQLAQAKQALQQATLVAPGSSVVAEVYGAAGEYLGPDGVHQYQAPPALPTNQSQGFQLFPSQPSSGGASTSATGTEPVVELIGGQQQIVAQIPESDVSRLPVGHRGSIRISALNMTTTGVVTEVVLNASRAANAVTYDVVFNLDGTLPGLLPGMSATVRPT